MHTLSIRMEAILSRGKERNHIMTISQGLLPELELEITKTRKTLERVPMEDFDWKPHEKSFAMGALANHLARLGTMDLMHTPRART